MTEIKVSQRAREAAARTAYYGGKPNVARCIRAGTVDQNWRVQTFASFEQAVRADERERAAKVAEGWPARSGDDQYQTCGNGSFWDEGTLYDQGRADAAAAIRAQGDEA